MLDAPLQQISVLLPRNFTPVRGQCLQCAECLAHRAAQQQVWMLLSNNLLGLVSLRLLVQVMTQLQVESQRLVEAKDAALFAQGTRPGRKPP